jgi:hypothetical protein
MATLMSWDSQTNRHVLRADSLIEAIDELFLVQSSSDTKARKAPRHRTHHGATGVAPSHVIGSRGIRPPGTASHPR